MSYFGKPYGLLGMFLTDHPEWLDAAILNHNGWFDIPSQDIECQIAFLVWGVWHGWFCGEKVERILDELHAMTEDTP